MTKPQFPQALSIAGSDSGGGAGMQADLKTMQMRHVFATTVLVAITAQNTRGVQKAQVLPPAMIDAQFAALAEDLQIKAVKTGMLAAPRACKCSAAWRIWASVRIFWPVKTSASGKFGVIKVANGKSWSRTVATASSAKSGAPPLAIITGSTVSGPKS